MVPNKPDMSNFHSLEVVGRGSETQLQVGKDLSYLISFIHSFLGSLILHECKYFPSFEMC